MKIYDYGNVDDCLICGNINGNVDKFIRLVVDSLPILKNYIVKEHPKEIERQKRLAKKKEEENNMYGISLDMPRKIRMRGGSGYDLSNKILIVDGFNNFGERELKYYYDKLENLNKVLSDNNSHILFIRGNDDPKYFEDELINLSNIKTIQDYSVIKLSKFNCLCIGGCVSIDRAWRKEQEKRVGRKMYWEGENIQYNEEDIDKILKEYDIACVITSSSPSFTFPGMNHIKNSSWVSEDKQVFKDIKDERLIMDKIYNKLTNANKKPYVWIYSRYNNSYQGMNNDIVFQSLYNFQFFSFKQSVESIFGVDFSKNLKSNGYGSKKQATKKKRRIFKEIEKDDDPFGFADLGGQEVLEGSIEAPIEEEYNLEEVRETLNNSATAAYWQPSEVTISEVTLNNSVTSADWQPSATTAQYNRLYAAHLEQLISEHITSTNNYGTNE